MADGKATKKDEKDKKDKKDSAPAGTTPAGDSGDGGGDEGGESEGKRGRGKAAANRTEKIVKSAEDAGPYIDEWKTKVEDGTRNYNNHGFGTNAIYSTEPQGVLHLIVVAGDALGKMDGAKLAIAAKILAQTARRQVEQLVTGNYERALKTMGCKSLDELAKTKAVNPATGKNYGSWAEMRADLVAAELSGSAA